MVEAGDKVVCQYDEWHNAHGEDYVIAVGERLTVRERYHVGGALFLRFVEIEATDTCNNPGFLATGFRPLRSYH
jgi:hypothetical protein